MKEKLVLVGNGMAGMRTIEELLSLAPDQYDISVFGEEPYGNYNRILLSPVLSGEKQIDDIILNTEQWYKDNNVTLHKGTRIDRIDRKQRAVIGADGRAYDYDRLLLATGSTPFVIPMPGHDLPGVLTFRDIKDVLNMMDYSKTYKHAVVIGAGLLGLEAAHGLMRQGMHVTVVHLEQTIMERQLDEQAGAMLQKHLQQQGLQFLTATQTAAIVGEYRVKGVRFTDGSEIAADLVVMAVGIRPNISLAQSAGIYCDRGVVVNDTMQTFDPRVYAVGECVQHRGATYGLVAPLFEQAKVCANHLANLGYSRYIGSLTSTKLKVTGVDLFSAGDFTGDDSTESIVMQDAAAGVYKKLILKNNKLSGAVLYGDTIDGAWYFQLMRDGTDVSDFRQQLMLGQSHLGDSGHGGKNAAMAMDDSMEVCGCNGVCKGTIVNSIVEKGLFTVDDVRAHTKASGSCGSCTGLVEQILASTLGGDYSAAPKEKAVCKCTEFTHEALRNSIRAQHLTSVRQVMDFLEWKTPDGCATCRPAINYYVLAYWPAEAKDDPQSRFINERAHANIQKDGTFSVVPRMWGGLTNPTELRAIADVVDKFKIPEVKVTGGQRIDLFGVPKEQLTAVWADLNAAGMVSGHAYGKALRTVKTCVGSQWCRFGTQDSTTMGVELERMSWGSWMPHKFKMAVSGCPRNCAEATIKDFGVVAVESGWELHVGGNGGVKVRATDLLCKVQTEAEVMEYCSAFIQLYRENANYLERTAPWIERVGLSFVKQQVVDDAATRKALAERFLESQRIVQKDPWSERAGGGVETQEFVPLMKLG
ncbi:MAG: nitrite reductase large subunit NirB [Gammaproteobacteria bacterium]|nr:nitrite reductase large subunit NirB [Gammaproteobacteria bacterium]MDH5801361.1 nitrite reductase large subunit NirB [Gammaproteobacteria bacterium]